MLPELMCAKKRKASWCSQKRNKLIDKNLQSAKICEESNVFRATEIIRNSTKL